MASTSVHTNTPALHIIDPRGLTVRAIAYCTVDTAAHPEPRVTRSLFSAKGNPLAVQDPRLFALSPAAPPSHSRQYSLSGKVLREISVDAGEHCMLYQQAGAPASSWENDLFALDFGYDLSGRLLWTIEAGADALPRQTEYHCYAPPSLEMVQTNRAGKLLRSWDKAGTLQVQEMNLTGQVVLQRHALLRTLDTPDWAGIEKPELDPRAHYSSAWAFNALGEAITQSDGLGNGQSFQRDLAGAVTLTRLFAADGSAAWLGETQRSATGAPIYQKAGNGIVRTQVYDPASGLVLEQRSFSPTAEDLEHLIYTHDPVGNILTVRDVAQGAKYFRNQRVEALQTYSYDSLYQLIAATGYETARSHNGPALPDWQQWPIDASRWLNYRQTFDYDRAGNLVRRVHVGANNNTLRMITQAHTNRSVPDSSRGVDGFDASGNLRASETGQRLTWACGHQLSAVGSIVREGLGDDVEHYRYDRGGQRVRKVCQALVDGAVKAREVHYLPGREVRISAARGERHVVFDAQAELFDMQTVLGLPARSGDKSGAAVFYVLRNVLGSAVMEFDADAGLVSSEGHYPFGGSAWWSGPGQSARSARVRRFCGKERDATGLYYFGLRYYACWLQRWICPDPAGSVDGPNRYRYVSNNPVMLVDRQGTQQTPGELLRDNFSRSVVPHVMSRIEEDKQAALNVLSSKWGMAGQQLGESLDRIINDLRIAPRSVNVRLASVPTFDGTGLQNTFANNKRGGSFQYYMDREKRDAVLVNLPAANAVFKDDFAVMSFSGPYVGIRSDLKPDAHPIFGSIQVQNQFPDTGGAPWANDTAYGESAFFVNPAVQEFMTYVPGDSMEIYHEKGPTVLSQSLAVDSNLYPLIGSAAPDQLDFYRKIVNDARPTLPMFPYVEWQAHTTIPFTELTLFTGAGNEHDSASRETLQKLGEWLNTRNIQSRRQTGRDVPIQ
jgi:insecticidal toxin complex protein TccC